MRANMQWGTRRDRDYEAFLCLPSLHIRSTKSNVLQMMGNRRYQSGRFTELLTYALNPANEFVMEELFNAGFESGELLCVADCIDFVSQYESLTWLGLRSWILAYRSGPRVVR